MDEQLQNPIQPQTPLILPPPSRKKTWLWISVGGVVLAILVGIFVWPAFQPNNIPDQLDRHNESAANQLKDWKTYTNTQYGFEFQYPQDFLIKSETNVNASFFPYNQNSTVPFSIDVSSTKDIDTYIQLKKADIAPGSIEILGHDQLGGYDSQIIETCLNVQPGFTCEKSMLIKHENYLYAVTYYSETRDENNKITPDGNNAIASSMLSTFKFTDQTSIDTVGWKTYTNTKYQFAFKYPSAYTIKEIEEAGVTKIELSTPYTQKIIEETTGEDNDILTISPRSLVKNYSGIFPEPISFTKNYFSSKAVSDWGNTYVGQIVINNKTGFQLIHEEATREKYTIFDNQDGTWFVVSRSTNWLEPYDTIVQSLQFTK